MLPGEVIEKFRRRLGASRRHVLAALADSFNRFLIILILPFKVLGQSIIESVSRALPAFARKLLQLRESFRF